MLDKLHEDFLGVQKNVPLKNYTTYKIGGSAKYFFVAKNKEDMTGAINFAKKNKLLIFILGGGSNLLVSDKGFNGLVVKISNSDIKFEGNKLLVDAGANANKVAHMCTERKLSGLEWVSGIPLATIGGTIFGNGQAFGEKISDIIESVEVLNLKTLKFSTLTKKQCQFTLKSSAFKKNKNLLIVSAVLLLKEKTEEEIKDKIKDFLKHRRTKHPMEFPSAGSTFVNPEIKIRNKNMLEKFPELSDFNNKGIIPAGYLIAKCGLAGKKIGNAQISEKHANFIINLGGAKAKDVLALIKLAKQKVKKVFNINLETEIQLIGF